MFCTAFNQLIARLCTDTATTALITAEGRFSFARLGTRVAVLHGALLADYPAGPVLVRGHKQADVVAAMIASTCAGRGFVFAEANFPAARVEQIIETCGCAVMIDVAGDGFAASVPAIDARALGDEPCLLPPPDRPRRNGAFLRYLHLGQYWPAERHSGYAGQFRQSACMDAAPYRQRDPWSGCGDQSCQHGV